MSDTEEFQDREMQCADGDKFIWTANDQKFYKEKGFTPPKRCKEHREQARLIREGKSGPAEKKETDAEMFGIK